MNVRMADTITGIRRGGAVVHYSVNGVVSLCGRFMVQGDQSGKRACKSCVRIGHLVTTPLNDELWTIVRASYLADRAESFIREPRPYQSWVMLQDVVNDWRSGEYQDDERQRAYVALCTLALEHRALKADGEKAKEYKRDMVKGDGLVNPNSLSKAVTNGASDKQIDFLRKLYAELDELEPMDSGSRVEVFEKDILPQLTKKGASNIIERCIELVKKARANKPKVIVEAPKAEGMKKGVYVLEGKFYRWTLSHAGRPYALLWNGSVWDYESAKGIVGKLTPTMAVTAEQAAAWGHEHDACIFCSLPLNDSRSRNAGYGKDCANNHSLPWG